MSTKCTDCYYNFQEEKGKVYCNFEAKEISIPNQCAAKLQKGHCEQFHQPECEQLIVEKQEFKKHERTN